MKMGSQILRTGMRCLGLMCANQAGSPPSRAQAQVSRDALAMLPSVTAKEMMIRPDTMAVVACIEPVTCVQISTMGKAALMARSISWMQNRMTRMIA